MHTYAPTHAHTQPHPTQCVAFDVNAVSICVDLPQHCRDIHLQRSESEWVYLQTFFFSQYHLVAGVPLYLFSSGATPFCLGFFYFCFVFLSFFLKKFGMVCMKLSGRLDHGPKEELIVFHTNATQQSVSWLHIKNACNFLTNLCNIINLNIKLGHVARKHRLSFHTDWPKMGVINFWWLCQHMELAQTDNCSVIWPSAWNITLTQSKIWDKAIIIDHSCIKLQRRNCLVVG